MSVEFRCRYGNADLCMNGGTCTELNLSSSGHTFETCACPPGYVHDYFGAHFNNCAFPENGALAILVAFSIVYSICLGLSCRLLWITKPWSLRRLLLILIVCIVVEWVWAIMVYAENGNYEVSNLMSGIDTIGMGVFAIEAAYTLLTPLNTLDPHLLHRMRRNFTLTEVCIVITFTTCYSALAAASRMEDPSVYNAIFASILVVTAIQIVATLVVVSRAMFQFEVGSRESALVAADSRNQAATLSLAERLRVARLTLVRATLVQVLPLIPLATLIAVLGSVPYMWVFWVLLSSINVWATFAISIVIAKQQSLGVTRVFCGRPGRSKARGEVALDSKENEGTISASDVRKLSPFPGGHDGKI